MTRYHLRCWAFSLVLTLISANSRAAEPGQGSDDNPFQNLSDALEESSAGAEKPQQPAADKRKRATPVSAPRPTTNGLARNGWVGGWLSLGLGGIGMRTGSAWSLSGRLDASPIDWLLVGVKARYNWKGGFRGAAFDGEAITGLIVSSSYKTAYETWFTEEEIARDNNVLTGKEKTTYRQTHHNGPLVTMRTDWALTGGVRFVDLFGAAVHGSTPQPSQFLLTAGLDRLKTNSDGQRYTFSIRALYDPSAGWGGSFQWMYANPPTWRFTYGVEAGLLSLGQQQPVTFYLAFDLGVAFGT